jgi:hypothetical protein
MVFILDEKGSMMAVAPPERRANAFTRATLECTNDKRA